MKKGYVNIDDRWAFVFCYDVETYDLDDIASWLESLGARGKDIRKACNVILGTNNGFTFSNDRLKMSVVAVSKASSHEQFMNSIAHEIDHLRYDICNYYDVKDGSEEEAYLQGYIMQGIVKVISRHIK